MLRTGRATLLAAASWSAAVLAAPVTSAWTCGVEPPGFVLPPHHVPAPRNVRPIVRLLTGDASSPCAAPPCAVDVAAIALRTAPGPGRPARVIAADVSAARAGAVTTFLVTPRVVLDARRRHEIVAVLRGRSDASQTRVLGSFATHDAFDRTAPVWTGMRSVELVPWRPPTPPGSRPGVVRLAIGPQPLRTFAEVWGRAAIDAETPPDFVSYAVRIAGPNGVVDRAAPPVAYFRGEVDLEPDERQPWRLFTLGQANECFAHTFDFPPAGTMKIGVTAVDLAGNESPLFEHALALEPASTSGP